MAEVKTDVTKEKETVVAYDVTIKNMYDGIEIQGDYLSGVVGDASVSYLAGNWSEYKKVKVVDKRTMIDYEMAVSKVKKYVNGKSSLESKVAFVYDKETSYYVPNWVFSSEDDNATYNISCLDGTMKVIK